MSLTCVYGLKSFDRCFLVVYDCFRKITDDMKMKGLREGILFRETLTGLRGGFIRLGVVQPGEEKATDTP